MNIGHYRGLFMKFLTGKKLLLAGFILVLLIGIPLSVYLIQQQQETRSQATPSTVLSFTPTSTETTPMQKGVGETVTLNVSANPGNNLISYLRLEINYDPDKLATEGAQPFVPNTTVFPTIIEGPIYQPGKVLVTLSIGGDPTKALGDVGTAGTITFKALAKTDSVPTQVSYGARSEVLSIAGPDTGSSDQANENVLSSTQPAFITIGDGGTVTPSLTVSPTASTSPTPTGTGGTTNVPPQCQGLAIDRQTSGTAPYSITFTANGTDSDGTISKVTFNFGDGPLVNETVGGGIGSNQVSLQKSHTYNNAGDFTATVIFTDDRGGVSTVGTCSQAISVTASSGGGGGGGTGGGNTTQPTATPTNTPTPTVAQNIPTPTATPVVTMPDTGPEDLFIGLGAVAGIITLIGGILFFAL
jgi:hypothetical protein